MKKREFKQLNQFRRDRIEALWREGCMQKDIAVIVGCHKSTVSREIERRKKEDGTYSAWSAQIKANVRRSNSKYQGMRIEQNPTLKNHIVSELRAHRSPDEIAGRMDTEGLSPSVQTAAIYRWLYSPFGQPYCKYLCTKRHGKRRTKYISGNKVPSLESKHMTESIQRIQKERPSDALVFDRGIENREHEKFGVQAYFCDPHAPHQKPLVEGSIGLLRRWFLPKGTDLSKVSEEELQEKIKILNNKYRKSLRYRSASEMENMILSED